MNLVVSLAAAALVSNAAMIDECRYADDAAAQAQWPPMRGTASATVTNLADGTALRLPCNFSGTAIERASWDHPVKLDLTACRGIQFKLRCRDTSPVSHFSIYFESGAGWYHASFFPEQTNDWNVITIDKAATKTEGKPGGWGQIKTIRLSAWRGADADTELLLRDLAQTDAPGGDACVAVVRGESAARRHPDEARAIEQYTEAMVEELRALDIGCAVLSDLDVTAARLRSAKLVVLPHNPQMPDNVADELARFANNGGKLLVFYAVPEKLRGVLRVSGGGHVRAKYSGNFSAMRFAADALPGAPPLVGQKSWNINEATPVSGESRVFAEWLDAKGQPTGHAAVLGSANGLVMTHVLLNDDAANKRRMLLAMVGYLVPDVWRNAVDASLAKIGATTDPSARVLREAALTLAAEKHFAEAMDKATEAQRQSQRAFCAAQRPERGEFRAFWCHSALGVEGMEWDEAIRRLAENGFTAILPNMLWGGAAFYDSQVLPVVAAEKGDQIAKCLAAGKKHGVQVHVWKVNWNLGHAAPAEFVQKMRSAGRLQMSSRGAEELWLCPSHPENQKLEIAAMVEVARKYDVAGIHFDYIRYPDGDHCFCAGCRERFERAVGAPVENWPRDVLATGALRQPWLDWRRGNITAVVRAVSEQARAIKPALKISAAVFRNQTTDRDNVGQDWKLWCEKGWVDFVCPMDYTASNRSFENMVSQQVALVGRAGCYPGIGVSASSSKFGIERLIEQIEVTRRYRTRGFTIFNYGATESRELLPLLGLGITAPK
jgi:uncharacterized lipoprotein YddW (UPF0748 family)